MTFADGKQNDIRTNSVIISFWKAYKGSRSDGCRQTCRVLHVAEFVLLCLSLVEFDNAVSFRIRCVLQYHRRHGLWNLRQQIFERLLTGTFFLFQRSTGTKHLLQTLKEYLAKTLHLGGILPFHPPKLWTILFYFDPVMIWLDMITASVKWQYSKTSKVEWPCRSMDPRNLSYSIYKERTTKPSSAWRSTQRSNQPVTRKVIGLPPNVLKLNYWVRLVCALSCETNCTRKFTN